MDGDDIQEYELKPVLDFPVVGIGASAGGLEAVTTMFQSVETGTGMAFVLVMHLDPDHESLMAELLSRKTHINVRQIADNDQIEVDCLHVIPPGSGLRIENGRFKLEPFVEPRGLRRPIDSFFISLAEMQGDRTACVVLSGTGADGTAGLRIVKEMGGVAAVQNPEEARYDGMPFSAIATKMVDFTLPAEELVPRLHTYFEGTTVPDPIEDQETAKEALGRIFSILRQSLGNDFTGYKKSTLLRRLYRRMQVLEITDLDDYIKLLKENFEEKSALAQDFLINVTSFFRDRENFEIMRKTVLIPLIENAEASDEIRIWVPGCSSGQEAYSIAMMIDETCEELQRRPLIQIFATDIDETMIAQARRGQYPISMFVELPKRYQDAYTIGLDGKFEVTSRIREMVRFSVHNLIQDPPFSKIDLISCRNLIIYFGEELQTNLFPLFHFSLQPDGYLFLGTSENVTRRGELFSAVDQRARIFRRANVGRRPRVHFPLAGTPRDGSTPQPKQKMSQEMDFPRHQSLDASNVTIYEHYAPPFVRCTYDGRIIDSSGDLSLFLMSRPGDERSLHALARDGIRDVILPMLSDTDTRDRRSAIKDVEVATPFGTAKVDLIKHPMRDDTAAIIFNVKERLTPLIDEYQVAPITQDRRISDLQEELHATQLLLKSKVEEIETANEELKSSNEEMMSMNEELQSANEELTTANEELKNKIDELTLANADLDNFLQSADLAMIVLDRGMRIRHVTNAAREIVPIQRFDRGRSLTEFNISLNDFDLANEIRHVMETSTPFSRTTGLNGDGKAFFVRITPYFFADGSVEGVSISLVDMSTEVNLRNALSLETEKQKLALLAGRMGLAEVDVGSGRVTIDDVVATQLGLKKSGEMTLDDMTKNFVSEDISLLDRNLSLAIEKGEEYEFDFRVNTSEDELRWIRTRGLPYTAQDGRRKVVGPMLDITDENAMERREILIREMSHRVKNLFGVISGLVQAAPKQSDDAQKLADDITARIASLGRAYDLARKDMQLRGAGLDELLNAILEPHVTSQKLTIKGKKVFVSVDCLNTFALVLHEMTTNAIKYGALSVPDGKLKVSWRTGPQGVTHLNWVESGKTWEEPQKDVGFGTHLIRTSMHQLKGEFNRKIAHDSVTIDLSAKLSHDQ